MMEHSLGDKFMWFEKGHHQLHRGYLHGYAILRINIFKHVIS